MESILSIDIMKLFECVDKRLSEFTDFLEKIVNIESYTSDKAGVDNVGKTIKDFSISHGFHVYVKHFDKAGDSLVISMNDSASLPPIAFTGHMDTVHPVGSWEKPLFRKVGEKFRGPGTYDMKGGIVVGLLVMQALKDMNYDERPVRFILVPDEELSEGLSGEDGKNFIRDNARGCAAAITLESGIVSEGMDLITVGRKASIRYKVNIIGKAAHAGEHYADGISAIKEAAQKILGIEAASDSKDITYNCGMINGGTSPNTVPSLCSFTLYNRYWRCDQRQVVKNHIEGILGHQFIEGTTCEWQVVGERPPMDVTEGNVALAEYLGLIAEKYSLGKCKTYTPSSGSDAVYTVQAGAPSVCSLGMTGEGAHEMTEFVWAESLPKRAKWIATAIVEMPRGFGERN